MMKLGKFVVLPLHTGTFKLDGGAMFGVVPKVLWQKTNPADENNRIDMAMRALYVEGENFKLVIDCGAGTKLNDKFKNIYEINTPGLRASLESRGIDPDSITHAVATHLHFDHAGSFTYKGDDGELKLSLPNAQHFVQLKQWEAALHPNEKDRASFFPENFVPIEEAGKLVLVDGEKEILPGVTLIPTNGHTPGHQVVLIDGREGERLLYCGDLIPLASHVNLPYIMAYDHYPLDTLREKKEILGRAADENWILFFEHDPVIEACRVKVNDKGRFDIAEELSIGD